MTAAGLGIHNDQKLSEMLVWLEVVQCRALATEALMNNFSYAAEAQKAINLALGISDWDNLGQVANTEIIEQLERLAGPHGYAILMALIARRTGGAHVDLDKTKVEGV